MNLPFFVAKRYLFAKKSHNAINIISGVSVAGVTVGTMALIIILSVFNGFDDLVKSLFNSFDPPVKIALAEGKTFVPDQNKLDSLEKIPGVIAYTKVLEENVLVRYGNRQFGEKQYIATVKGVDDNYLNVSGLDSMIVEGKFSLKDKNQYFAVVGRGIAYNLTIGLSFIYPLNIYVPGKTEGYAVNLQDAIKIGAIYPKGIFSIEEEYDSKYIITPYIFLAKLLNDTNSISALEVKLSSERNLNEIQTRIEQLFGSKFSVKNRFQQKEVFYKIMKYEKWAIFFILSFILMVASFNIISSLSMLIIEKKKDIATFQSMGADRKTIRRIFMNEGLMISFFGAIVGTLLGTLVCWIQQRYGIIKLSSSGTFIIDAYPVAIRVGDIISTFFIVMAIGIFSAWYPVKYIVSKYIPENFKGEEM